MLPAVLELGREPLRWALLAARMPNASPAIFGIIPMVSTLGSRPSPYQPTNQHATTLQASKDFKGGAAAIREAISILKDVYDSKQKKIPKLRAIPHPLTLLFLAEEAARHTPHRNLAGATHAIPELGRRVK